jgi:amino-acid N-acetyltransferase
MHDHVNWLRHASPYINAHRDCTFVVMLPGEGVDHPNFGNIVHDLVLLHSLGVRLVLVHGSRPQIEARLASNGLTPRYHRSLRITDSPTLECVIDAVGHLRIAIEARLSMDMARSPMQGSRLRVTTRAKCGASTARASIASWMSAASCCSRRSVIRQPGRFSTWPAKTSPPARPST